MRKYNKHSYSQGGFVWRTHTKQFLTFYKSYVLILQSSAWLHMMLHLLASVSEAFVSTVFRSDYRVLLFDTKIGLSIDPFATFSGPRDIFTCLDVPGPKSSDVNPVGITAQEELVIIRLRSCLQRLKNRSEGVFESKLRRQQYSYS